MSVDASLLRELHRIHRQLADLRERLRRGPQQVKAVEAGVKKLDDELLAAREGVKKSKLNADQKNLQLKEREARLAKLQKKLEESDSARDYKALQEQIAADEQANSVLTDEVLEALEKTEQLQKQVPVAEAALAKSREDAAKVAQRIDEERQSLEQEVARVNEQLREAEAKLPADFKPDYDRAVKSRGEDALAPVDGTACGGCYQMLTPQTFPTLLTGKPAYCKACGRILYLPEDRSIK